MTNTAHSNGPTHRARWSTCLVACVSLSVLLPCRLGLAHPLGNFSVNHYTSLHVTQEAIEIRYIIDLAEIPTFQELQEANLVPQEGHPSLPPYLAMKPDSLRPGLRLTVNGQPLVLQVVAREILFPAGAGGLPTLKLGVVYRALYEPGARDTTYHLHYRDDNFPGRAGWQEIIAVAGAGMTFIQSSVPGIDRSRALTDYPVDVLNSPPQVREAAVFFSQLSAPPAENRSSALALTANAQATPRNAFTELVATPQLSLEMVLLALAVAMGLGALHALEPGHGKTVVAAYLVGTRGTARHAFYLGLVVTLTHTAGVYMLGVVTLYASHYVVPERLYPWLSVLSGLSIAGLGGYLLVRHSVGGAQPPAHHHGASLHSHPPVPVHSHDQPALVSHQHAGYSHAGPPGLAHHTHHPLAGETVSWRELLTLGITGGIVPCPAALVVLLSAVALHRIGFGLALIVAFSSGLAVVLITIGLLMVYARQFMTRLQGQGTLCRRWLPLTSAAVVTLLGLVMTCETLFGTGLR